MSIVWFDILSREIRNAPRICILGVGNIQKGDDGAGSRVIKFLEKKIEKVKLHNIKLIDCGETPENFTGEIRKFMPDLTIIIDACISGKKPGEIFIVNLENIANQDISTHRLPLSMFVKFLEETVPTKVIVIGIEPKNLDFGDDISAEVSQAIEKMALLLAEPLNN